MQRSGAAASILLRVNLSWRHVEVMATLHACSVEIRHAEDVLLYGGYGPAVTSCNETEGGSLWVGNIEYESRVNFCPFCGFKARQQIVFEGQNG
jgi:hypothetical protein